MFFLSKVIHLELVSDSSTPAFIAVLRRFVARRGKPNAVYSDCSSVFVRADKGLKNFMKLTKSKTHNEVVNDYISSQGIK